MNPAVKSTATRPNDRFSSVPRRRGEDNVRWIGRNLPKARDLSFVVLLGGRGPLDVRLRVAQAHVRDDVTPSHWSHAALMLRPAARLPATRIHHVSLEPDRGFGWPPAANAIQVTTLRRFASTEAYPNVAVIGVPITPRDAGGALRRFMRQRSAFDAVDLLVLWLAFAWGAGASGNPLMEGRGMPSAAMVESVMSAAGFDLTPGLESRSSCPDALWQAAKWWHEYYAKVARRAPVGAWCVEHRLD